jgi:hypothetical protein
VKGMADMIEWIGTITKGGIHLFAQGPLAVNLMSLAVN